MQTNDLIERLANDARPVRRLPSPWARTVLWFAIAAPYVAAVVIAMSPRPDLMEKLSDLRFQVEQIAALATSVAAAVAAFAAIIPGYNRKILFLPLVPLAVWLASLGSGCIDAWLRRGVDGIVFRPDWICFPAIALVGAMPAVVMVIMLRRGAPLLPHMTMALGALAAAALGNFGLRLFHPQDASLMVLVWQFGSVALMSVMAGSIGRKLLDWHLVTAR